MLAYALSCQQKWRRCDLMTPAAVMNSPLVERSERTGKHHHRTRSHLCSNCNRAVVSPLQLKPWPRPTLYSRLPRQFPGLWVMGLSLPSAVKVPSVAGTTAGHTCSVRRKLSLLTTEAAKMNNCNKQMIIRQNRYCSSQLVADATSCEFQVPVAAMAARPSTFVEACVTDVRSVARLRRSRSHPAPVCAARRRGAWPDGRGGVGRARKSKSIPRCVCV